MYFSFILLRYILFIEMSKKRQLVIMPHDTLEIRFYRMVAHKETLIPFSTDKRNLRTERQVLS